MIKFLYPQAFWGFAILLVLLVVIGYGYIRRRSLLRTFGQEHLIAPTSRLPQTWQRGVQEGLLAGAMMALIVALARPVWPGGSVQVKEGTLDVVAILDVSRSMAAEDYADGISRLQRAKDIIFSLLPDLTGNRMGLVLFARESFIQANLTDDLVALKFVLQNWVKIETAPGGGSNLPAALSDALSLFKKDFDTQATQPKEDRNKLILFFSDGGDTLPEDLLPILQKLSLKNIKIVAVGLGSLEGSKVPVYGKDGKFEDWFEIDGQLAITRLNEAPLKEMASKTGGKYVRITSGKELKGLFQDTNLVGEKTMIDQKELFQIPLSLALLFLVLRKSPFLSAS